MLGKLCRINTIDRERKLFSLRGRFVLASVVFCVYIGLCARDLSAFTNEYGPLLGVPLTPRRINAYVPLHSLCRRGSAVAVLDAPSIVPARELVIKFVALTPATVSEVETLLNDNWGDSSARRSRRYAPKSLRPMRDDPPRWLHLSVMRTLEVIDYLPEGRTLLTHETHIRICPAGTN